MLKLKLESNKILNKKEFANIMRDNDEIFMDITGVGGSYPQLIMIIRKYEKIQWGQAVVGLLALSKNISEHRNKGNKCMNIN